MKRLILYAITYKWNLKKAELLLKTESREVVARGLGAGGNQEMLLKGCELPVTR